MENEKLNIDDIVGQSHRVSLKDKYLRSGVSWKSFCAFLISCMMSISGLVFINAAQTYVLIDILNYPRNRLGYASGSLAFADELLSVPLASFWGFLSDKIGRRLVMTVGLIFMSLSICLYPWANQVFPDGLLSFFSSLLFFRLIFALGGSASTAMMTALIGDYAIDSSRAKVAGIVGTSAGLGALLAALVFTRLPILFSKKQLDWAGFSRPDIVLTFSITAALLLLTASLSGIFMQTPLICNQTSMTLKQRLRTGVFAIR